MHPDNPDSTMLAKATKVLQEHVKDVTEKTKHNCCVAKPVLKENMVIPNYNTNDPSLHYIVDKNTGVTYIRGKLLGKVSVKIQGELYVWLGFSYWLLQLKMELLGLFMDHQPNLSLN